MVGERGSSENGRSPGLFLSGEFHDDGIDGQAFA